MTSRNSQLPSLNDGFECRAFHWSMGGQSPGRPHGFLWLASPETLHFCADFFDFEGEEEKNTYQHLPQEPTFPPGDRKYDKPKQREKANPSGRRPRRCLENCGAHPSRM